MTKPTVFEQFCWLKSIKPVPVTPAVVAEFVDFYRLRPQRQNFGGGL